MYRIQDISEQQLKQLVIPHQDTIERYKGSKLNPWETYNILKESTNGFKTENPIAKEVDQLLYWLVYPEAKAQETQEMYQMSDGTKWKILSKEEALEQFQDNKEVYAINRKEETEHLIESEKDFKDWEEFALEYPVKKEPQNNSKKQSKEAIRIRQKQQESELILLELELELELESKKKK